MPKKSSIVTLKKIKDGAKFRLSKRTTAAVYELNRKWKGKATFTSLGSNRSYERDQTTVVYPI